MRSNPKWITQMTATWTSFQIAYICPQDTEFLKQIWSSRWARSSSDCKLPQKGCTGLHFGKVIYDSKPSQDHLQMTAGLITKTDLKTWRNKNFHKCLMRLCRHSLARSCLNVTKWNMSSNITTSKRHSRKVMPSNQWVKAKHMKGSQSLQVTLSFKILDPMQPLSFIWVT